MKKWTNEKGTVLVEIGPGFQIARRIRWTYRNRHRWQHHPIGNTAIRDDRFYAFVAWKSAQPGVDGESTVIPAELFFDLRNTEYDPLLEVVD